MSYLQNLDKNLLVWLNGAVSSSSFWRAVTEIAAAYLIYLIPLIFIVLWFWREKNAKKVALSALFSLGLGLIINSIIGPLINRPRPFETKGVQEIFFHRPDYSFPSDHATLLFAIVFSFWFSGHKKLAIWMFILALFITVARVAAGIHFPSDILGGALLGLLAAGLIWFLDQRLQKVYNFVIKMAHKLKLA